MFPQRWLSLNRIVIELSPRMGAEHLKESYVGNHGDGVWGSINQGRPPVKYHRIAHWRVLSPIAISRHSPTGGPTAKPPGSAGIAAGNVAHRARF
jgi:hypothetical protein